MKQTIKVETRHAVNSMLTGIGFSVVSDWYHAAYRTLKMDLIIPKHRENQAPRPCLLFLCGGAFCTVNGSVWMPEMVYFAERGYVVATAEYRTTNQAAFPAALIDAKSAVRFLKAHATEFCIDPAKIVVAGESAGGTLCSLVGVTGGMAEFEQGDYLEYDSKVAAVVDYYGLVDMAAIHEDLPGILEKIRSVPSSDAIPPWMLEAFLGLDYTREEMDRASAITYVNPKTPPFMILHGTEDIGVDIAHQSDAFYERLVENGVKAAYYRLEGEGHGADAFYQPEIKEKVIAFLDEIFAGDK